mmetsp:Transcript_11730/g.24579  ORF Transcript_11730/g.24579 Transcript_11730/m.24579 type:complete len:272 (+) Transcript_11730:1516-2331(+)
MQLSPGSANTGMFTKPAMLRIQSMDEGHGMSYPTELNDPSTWHRLTRIFKYCRPIRMFSPISSSCSPARLLPPTPAPRGGMPGWEDDAGTLQSPPTRPSPVSVSIASPLTWSLSFRLSMSWRRNACLDSTALRPKNAKKALLHAALRRSSLAVKSGRSSHRVNSPTAPSPSDGPASRCMPGLISPRGHGMQVVPWCAYPEMHAWHSRPMWPFRQVLWSSKSGPSSSGVIPPGPSWSTSVPPNAALKALLSPKHTPSPSHLNRDVLLGSARQ